MNGSTTADLGLGPVAWLFLTLVGVLALFFKFGRVWSIRNFDLLLLLAPAPGLLRLVGSEAVQPWWAFGWLMVGSGLWLVRCLIDLGLSRRPLLEPNLDAGGLAVLICGLLGLLLFETATLPGSQGAARNPADPHARPEVDAPPPRPESTASERTVHRMLSQAPSPRALKRTLAAFAHTGLVMGLLAVGWRIYGQRMLGLGMAACYLILPYTRIAVLDTGQLLSAALIVAAVLVWQRPSAAGALLGLAGAWMPAALGLVPLWAGFYRGRGAWRFLGVSLGLLLVGGGLAVAITPLSDWARALGARSLAEAGLLPGIEEPRAGSFWTLIDPAFRLPVLVGYLALVGAAAFFPIRKDLAHLIALSAGLLVASQFWYLDVGGTHVALYLPLVLLMVFRPSLAGRRAPARATVDGRVEAPAPSPTAR